MAEEKPWYQSKGKWAGILMMAGSLISLVIEWLNTGSVPQAQLVAFLNGLGIFGIRDAIK